MIQALPSHARPGISRSHPFRSGERCSIVVARTLLPILLLLILAVPFGRHAHAASDDYLKAIDAEGNRLEFLGQAKKEHEMLMRVAPQTGDSQKPRATRKKTVKAIPSPAPHSATRAVGASASAEFEQALKKNFPGSFALYSLLEPQEKAAVFHEYENANSEGTIRFLPAVSKIISFNSMANKAK